MANSHVINQLRKDTYKHLLINNRLRLAIINTCNLSCFYCHNEGQPHCDKPTTMSLDYVKTMVRWFQDNEVYVERINLTGGEPLLHPDLIAIIDECRKITDDIRINTNGTLLTGQLIDTFCQHGVLTIKIGIDSLYTEQTKPNLHAARTNSDRVLKMIKYANKRMRVVLNSVVTKYNYKNIDSLIDFAIKIGISKLKIIRLNDLDSRNLNAKDDVPEDVKTNQTEGLFYFGVYQKYIAQALHYDYYPYKGRTDVFIDSVRGEFNIRFCDDVCVSGACANMFTEIDAGGNLMVCPRYHITFPIDFNKDFNTVRDVITEGHNRMCDSRYNRYQLRDNQGV